MTMAILNSPDQIARPSQDFFNTVYHLKAEPAREQTLRLVELLSER